MNTAKERLLKIIEEIPDHEIVKILDFAEYINALRFETLLNMYRV